MGLLAFPVMLQKGYDRKLASGVVCAGGCLGILIPPSILLILYAAISGISAVRLYAGAFIPGFMLAGFYVAYVMGRVIINPKLAPKLPREMTDIPWIQILSELAQGDPPPLAGDRFDADQRAPIGGAAEATDDAEQPVAAAFGLQRQQVADRGARRKPHRGHPAARDEGPRSRYLQLLAGAVLATPAAAVINSYRVILSEPCFAVAAAPGALYAGVATGVKKSTNGGATWEPLAGIACETSGLS